MVVAVAVVRRFMPVGVVVVMTIVVVRRPMKVVVAIVVILWLAPATIP